MNLDKHCRHSKPRAVPCFLPRFQAQRPLFRRLSVLGCLAWASLCSPHPAAANNPGGGTGSGANVTITAPDSNGMVTMSNGILSVTVDTQNSHVTSVLYTYNNSGTTSTAQMLQASNQYYWGGFVNDVSTGVSTQYGNMTFTYTLATNPTSNGGERADMKLVSTSQGIGGFEVHFTMQKGSPGFYTTAILTHGSGDAATTINAFGLINRVPSNFNWLSADETRNFFRGTQPTTLVPHLVDVPKETNVDADGTNAGEYDNKFFTAQDHGDLRAWGWSSVGSGNPNLGVWMMKNLEYSDGGPLKRDCTAYPGNNLNVPLLTQEVGQGSDSTLAAGETWTKVCGPWLYYVNNVSASITDPAQAAEALYSDALAQDAAEKAAWPYSWFPSAAYVPPSGRGTVTGQLAINDPDNRNPTVSGTWVGVVQQPITSSTPQFYDFQKWLKPYQYWTQTSSSGSFTIPDVIAGANYTLWAYGPGAAGTFLSQNQNGGNPPFEYTLPSTPFAVSVSAGQTNNLGTVTWTPKRVGATVFELGYPDRKTDKYLHGDDYWAPEHSPKTGYPTSVWGGQAYFLLDFPTGTVNYTVGASRWDTDWNYVLPSQPNTSGAYQPATATISFNLASAPAASAQASLYLGVAGDNGGNVILSVNGTNLGNASGVTASPQPVTASGYNPLATGNYQDNSSIHLSDHGPFQDERINFPGSLLKAGTNTLTIDMNAVGYSYFLMVDYLRLELAGYVPPPPASVTVYPGNNCNLVTWPVVPGAARYNVLRSTTSGSGYVSLASGLLGPVSGSDSSVMTYTDTTAANNTTYYYVVESWNLTGGYSANSPQSAGQKPLSSFSTSAPAAPAGLAVTSSGHHSVALSWGATSGANYYKLSRTNLYPDGAGGEIALRTVLLDDAVAGTTYTDTTVTDGKMYSYAVQAVNPVGTSSESSAVTARPLPAAPSAAPSGLAASAASATSIKLTWSAVPGATGYVIYRSTTSGGPFSFPANFDNACVETSLTDTTNLTTKTTYYYQVSAVNSAGVSSPASTSATTQ